MYLSGFHLDGFGIYHGQTLTGIPPGLVLFLGDNEAGKTTLMEFIRAVLFGLRKPGKENHYPPYRGGIHGGRLQVVMADGRSFTIERLPKRVAITGADSTVDKTEPAHRLLHGLDRTTFEHIFAIGLKELQGLEVLSHRDVRDRLFSASAGLGSASVPDALKFLQKELDDLTTGQSRTKKIDLFLKDLHALEHRLGMLKKESALYADTRQRLESLQAAVKERQAQIQALGQQLNRLAQLERARPAWISRETARRQAAELKFARDFPPQGLSRWEKLTTALAGVAEELAAKESEADRLREELGGLAVDEAVLAQRQAIEELWGGKDRLAAALAGFPAAQQRLEQTESILAQRLADLGPGWDKTQLETVDTSVAVRQEVQEFGRQWQDASREVRETEARVKNLDQAAGDAEREARQAQEAWEALPAPGVADAAELKQREEALWGLRTLLTQRERAATRREDRQNSQAEAQRRADSLAQQAAAPPDLTPWWLIVAAAIPGLALGGWFAWRADWWAAGLTAAAALLLAVIFLAFRQRQKRRAITRREDLAAEAAREASLAQNLAQDIGRLDQELARLEEDAGQTARGAGLPVPADLPHLEEMARELAAVREQWQHWRQAREAAARGGQRLAEARDRLAAAEAEAQRVKDSLESLAARWTLWLTRRGFAPEVRPEGFTVVLQAVDAARIAASTVEECRQHLTELDKYLTGQRQRLAKVLAECGRSPSGAEPGVADLEALQRALAEARLAQERQRSLEESLARSNREAARLLALRETKEQEQAQLLAQAGADDEEDFRRREAAHQEWLRCREKMAAAQETLLNEAGHEAALTALEQDLRATDPLELQTGKQAKEALKRELEETLAVNQRELGSLSQKLADLAQKEELSDLLLNQRCRREELRQAVRRWATLAVCRHLMEETRSLYERERQPPVIQAASGFFRTMTGDRYQLVASVGAATLQLEDAALQRTDEVCWSAGLQDQVYLALRLGLAREFGLHAEPLPLILDDVLVKFDARRRKRTAQVILDFARRQQVLFFSCHQEYRRIFMELAGAAPPPAPPVTCYTIADGVIGAENRT